MFNVHREAIVKRWGRLALFSLATLCAPPISARGADTTSGPSSSPAIEAIVVNTRGDRGRVGCQLFIDSDPWAFPRKGDKAVQRVWALIKDGKAACQFHSVPAGKYAVTAFQDEDMNGKMRSNFLGMPLEGYGFSDNPTVRFSAPSFSDASFNYDGGSQTVTISLQYWSP